MKTRIIIFALTIAVFYLFTSCTKENLQTENIKPTICQKDLKISENIKNFLSTVELFEQSPAFKSDEFITDDSALIIIEASINYAHAFPARFYNEFNIDTTFLSFHVNERGEVSIDELVSEYLEMKDTVAYHYHNSTFENKKLALVDIEPYGQIGGNSSYIILTVIGDTKSDPPPIGVDGPFVEGDDWWYGEDEGKCSLPVYTSDAAKQIQLAMNNYIPDPNGNYYFVRLMQITKAGGDPSIRRVGDPNPPDNFFDFYLYNANSAYGNVNSDILCLDYTELNVYFTYLHYLLYSMIPNEELPVGYSIESVLFMEGKFETWGGNYTQYFHRGIFQFGIKVHYDQGEGPTNL